MKTYRELYFEGSLELLTKFTEEINKFVVGDWEQVNKTERWKDYLFFDYNGDDVDRARVSIYIGDNIYKGKLKVGNIIPLDKNQLSVDEYNAILVKFYNDVIKPYKESGAPISISQPTDDVFNPTSVITEKALEKLKSFCRAANKSTGSSHPCDRERWFDFICQTVDDDKMFDASTLATFLQDETYWGKKPQDFMGVMGNYAWDEEKAYELAYEYESLCEIIQYYKKTRGV